MTIALRFLTQSATTLSKTITISRLACSLISQKNKTITLVNQSQGIQMLLELVWYE